MASVSKRIATAIMCLIGIGVFLYTIYSYDFNTVENSQTITTAQIGERMMSYGEGGFILPFEVISVLLLAAMIGAIVIAKGKKLSNNNNQTI